MDDNELHAAARRHGIALSYHDLWGHERHASDQTLRALLLALGPHEAPATAPNAPHQPLQACFLPAHLAQRRCWGLAIQLYGLRSPNNWGIGDFSDLGVLAQAVAPHGVDLIGLNPLHALFPDQPNRCSPYSPSSRLFVNPIYIDVDAVGDLGEAEAAQQHRWAPAFVRRLEELRRSPQVDYAGVWEAKQEVLRLLYRSFAQRHLTRDSGRARAFRTFCAEQGEALERFTTFCMLQEHMKAHHPTATWWGQWPAALREATSTEVDRLRQEHHQRCEYHAYLQWLADDGLNRAQRQARDAGMRIGLYRDLAVGCDRAGADTWMFPTRFATAVSIGAPPDDFNLGGQDWGLPPPIPAALVRAACEPLAAAIQRNMRHTGALRIDHIMGLHRLFWIPAGMPAAAGAYVHYPSTLLFNLLARASHEASCLIIGEDLGTVPPIVRQNLKERCIFSTKLFWFERNDDNELVPPHLYETNAIVAAATHDSPTLAGYWAATDLTLRSTLGLFPSPNIEAQQRQQRQIDRHRLLRALAREGLAPEDAEALVQAPQLPQSLNLAVHRYLARTPAKIMMVQLEDVLGLCAQANLPGTIDEHPNWRRKLPVDVTTLSRTELFAAMASAIAAERGAPPSMPSASGHR